MAVDRRLQVLARWASLLGCSHDTAAVFSQGKWSKRRRERASKWVREPRNQRISEGTFHHFCYLLLVTQTSQFNVGQDSEKGYQAVGITGGPSWTLATTVGFLPSPPWFCMEHFLMNHLHLNPVSGISSVELNSGLWSPPGCGLCQLSNFISCQHMLLSWCSNNIERMLEITCTWHAISLCPYSESSSFFISITCYH